MKLTKKQKVRNKIKMELVKHLTVECIDWLTGIQYDDPIYVIRISPEKWHKIFKTK